jgi:hypothetical protein
MPIRAVFVATLIALLLAGLITAGEHAADPVIALELRR